MNELLRHVFNDFEYIFTQPERDAATMPLATVKDMWAVRWGNEWVNRDEFNKDQFWMTLLVRLLQDKAVETHYPANQISPVYRLKHANN
jgi:hypothetical protein